MEDLIKALKIFQKYLENKNSLTPTNCIHDLLMVMDIEEEDISDADKDELEKLSFEWNDEHQCWSSFRFGSS